LLGGKSKPFEATFLGLPFVLSLSYHLHGDLDCVFPLKLLDEESKLLNLKYTHEEVLSDFLSNLLFNIIVTNPHWPMLAIFLFPCFFPTVFAWLGPR
jgi:hypothetical protein